jgi:hypothetical protein
MRCLKSHLESNYNEKHKYALQLVNTFRVAAASAVSEGTCGVAVAATLLNGDKPERIRIDDKFNSCCCCCCWLAAANSDEAVACSGCWRVLLFSDRSGGFCEFGEKLVGAAVMAGRFSFELLLSRTSTSEREC